MANEVTGIDGNFAFTAMQVNAYGWSITHTADEHDATTFADSGDARYKAGNRRAVITANLHWADDNTAVVGTSASATLTATTGETYTCTAIFQQEETSVNVNELNSTIATFRVSGAVTKPT
jgi:hypothetical protein